MTFEGTPSEAVQSGVCPVCYGSKRIHVMVPPPDHDEPCPLCQNTGKWPPPEVETDDPAYQAAREHAENIHCTCIDIRPRWRPCRYHEGYIDGFDAARS
jgi:hypothetical protein